MRHWGWTAATLVCMTSMAVQAGGDEETTDLQQSIAACAQEENPLQRLVCYDEIATAMGADVELTSAPETEAETDPETSEAETAEDSQASTDDDERVQRLAAAEERAAEAERRAAEAEERLRDREEGQDEPLDITDKTYVTIVDSWQNPRGLWRFELENGEVWQQTTTDSHFRFDPDRSHYIEPGRLNNFFFSHDDTNRRLRVQRAN